MEGVSVHTTLGGIELSDGKGIKQVMQTVTHSSQRGYNLSTPVFSSNKLADSLKLVLAKQIHAKKKLHCSFHSQKFDLYNPISLFIKETTLCFSLKTMMYVFEGKMLTI